MFTGHLFTVFPCTYEASYNHSFARFSLNLKRTFMLVARMSSTRLSAGASPRTRSLEAQAATREAEWARAHSKWLAAPRAGGTYV